MIPSRAARRASFIVALTLFVSACNGTAGIARVPVREGVPRTLTASVDDAHEAVKRAFAKKGYSLKRDEPVDASTWMVIGSTGVSGFSWGELVRAVVTRDDQDHCTVRIYTEASLAPNISAQGTESFADELLTAIGSELRATGSPSRLPSPSSVAVVARAPAPPPSAPARPQTPIAFAAASPQPRSYAFIVGIDKYRDVPSASGARADAERFAELARKTLGLKEDHVRVALEDHATKQDVERGLAWLKNEVPAGGRAYFFFSGHGAPGTDQSAYLVPYDADARDIPGTAIRMSDVMKVLAASKANDVLALVDACFSGAGGRSVLPPGARPLMRVKEDAPSARLALFTASQGDEISGPAPGEDAGVFTKYVTGGLATGQADIDGDGQVSLAELSAWVSPRVAKDAKRDKREQHPKLTTGSGVGGAESFIVEYGVGK